MNSNKRKSRSNTSRIARPSKGPERSIVAEGVYSNARFMHSVTSLIGHTVQVQTQNGSTYEGIFCTFSQQFDIVLELPHKVDMSQPSHIDVNSITEKLIFRPQDVVMVAATNVDLDFATKGSPPIFRHPWDQSHAEPLVSLDHQRSTYDVFQTDRAISKFNGQVTERELEPWDGELEGTDGMDLDGESANGWDANEMFKKNEQVYGVQSTYDHTLTGYTVQLKKKNTKDYKDAEAKAAKIANEIEANPSYRQRIELENGDEEDKFSAVHRPEPKGESSSSSGKYLPPAKRKNPQAGKLIRSTPPPPPHSHPHSNNPAPSKQQTLHSSQTIYHQPPLSAQSVPPSCTPPQQQQNASSYHTPTTQNVPSYTQAAPSAQQAMATNSSQYHNPGSANTHPHPPAGPGPRQQSPSQTTATYPTPSYFTAQHSAPYNPQTPPSYPPNTTQYHNPVPAPMQVSTPKSSELRVNGEEGRVPEAKVPSEIARIPTEQARVPDPSLNNPRASVSAALNTAAAAEKPPMEPVKSEPHSMPEIPVVRGNERKSGNSKGREEQIEELKKFGKDFKLSESDLEKKQQPVDENKESEVDKVTSTLKKSTLNPNAKSFTPRSPGAPTPPRPHTPQTPQITPQPPMPVMQAAVMPAYMVATTQPPFSAASQGNRFRPKISLTHRHEMAPPSPIHVAAATGQPLLAPAPMTGQFTLPYAHQGAMMPATPQPYPQPMMMRMVTPQHSMLPVVPTSVSYSDNPQHSQMYMSPTPSHGPPQQHPPQQHPQPNPSPAHNPPGSIPSQPPNASNAAPQQIMYNSVQPIQPHQTTMSQPPMQPSSHTPQSPANTYPQPPPTTHTGIPMVLIPQQQLPPAPHMLSQSVPVASSTGTSITMTIPQYPYIHHPQGPGSQPPHIPTIMPHSQ